MTTDPASRTRPPYQLGTTIYGCLGLDPASEVHDKLGRPLQLNRGQLIEPLFSGQAV